MLGRQGLLAKQDYVLQEGVHPRAASASFHALLHRGEAALGTAMIPWESCVSFSHWVLRFRLHFSGFPLGLRQEVCKHLLPKLAFSPQRLASRSVVDGGLAWMLWLLQVLWEQGNMAVAACCSCPDKAGPLSDGIHHGKDPRRTLRVHRQLLRVSLPAQVPRLALAGLVPVLQNQPRSRCVDVGWSSGSEAPRHA